MCFNGLIFLLHYGSATQFLSRGIPFIFNLWIVRHLTEEDYAVLILINLSSICLDLDVFLSLSSCCHWIYLPFFCLFVWFETPKSSPNDELSFILCSHLVDVSHAMQLNIEKLNLDVSDDHVSQNLRQIIVEWRHN